MSLRIGIGIDSHQLLKGIPLIIGGVLIPFEKGSKGHSDGDVLFHSIVDAILGASSLGDIGMLFPSNDKKWKNAQSKIFLKHANKLIEDHDYKIQNIDSTIILQNPILNSYFLEMRENISSILSLHINCISVKATTTDYLGFIGKGEGIASMATVLLKRTNG